MGYETAVSLYWFSFAGNAVPCICAAPILDFVYSQSFCPRFDLIGGDRLLGGAAIDFHSFFGHCFEVVICALSFFYSFLDLLLDDGL